MHTLLPSSSTWRLVAVCAYVPSTCGRCYQGRWPKGGWKEDGWRKEGTRQTIQDSIHLILHGSVFLFLPLCLCLFQTENQLPFSKALYNFTSKLNENIHSAFTELKMVSKVFIDNSKNAKQNTFIPERKGFLVMQLSHHIGNFFSQQSKNIWNLSSSVSDHPCILSLFLNLLTPFLKPVLIRM